MRPRSLAVFVCVAACEREPRHEAPPPPPPPQPVVHDIVLLIDLSKSMEETDLPPDRLGALQTAVRGFVAHSPRDRFGVVLFAQATKQLQALTDDRGAVDRELEELRIGDVAELGTAMGDGLALAVDTLRPATHRKVVVLVSDGDTNWVTHYDPEQATQLAKTAGITIYTVLVGRDQTDALGGMAVNPAELQHAAAATGGTFVRAGSMPELEHGLQAVRAKLDADKR